MDKKPLRTREEVLNDFRRKGISIAAAARSIGIDRATVYHVLHKDNPNSFGKAHKAAVLLGIKDGEIVEDSHHGDA
jgi:gp16 family phage-associated protein